MQFMLYLWTDWPIPGINELFRGVSADVVERLPAPAGGAQPGLRPGGGAGAGSPNPLVPGGSNLRMSYDISAPGSGQSRVGGVAQAAAASKRSGCC
jgi:hypothetical protein